MMKEILITSSVLILAILALRLVFRGVLSRRVQYALWALVLVRLLVPVSLPAADFSVMTAARPVQAAVAERVTAPVYVPVAQAPLTQHPTAPDAAPEQIMEPTQDRVWVVHSDETAVQYRKLSVEQVLRAVWVAGMAVMGLFFLGSNGRFYLRLRKNRRAWASTARPYGGKRKVFLVPEEVIPSPCLFGRSIYITPAVARDQNKLRHVLCHEETHAKHRDPLWSLLRCLCLTIYWFDPLVWIAARCSRTDCELACDESVLKALGEEERIPYGKTLVSLIPVKRGGNPMIAATTMTAGKRQLRDRVSRIARRPRQLMAAALAVAVLAGVVSACTFTGGTENNDGKVPGSGPEALAGEELRWFNEAFFNHNENPAISYTYTIRNQFASPAILYERPEDIDLYELFYLEGATPTDQELRTVLGQDPATLPCPAYRLTTEEIDRLLVEYTGRCLEETNKMGLDHFTYSQEFDAYFWMHGDTNYCGDLDFLCGTREGDTVKLYHTSDFAGSSWYCVTLTQVENLESPYLFVSNLECETPDIPTSLPTWEPEATIDLSTLEPYIAPTVTVETHVGDVDTRRQGWLDNWDFDGHNVVIYRSTDGNIYAALCREDGSMDVFLEGLSEESSMFFYHDLLGHSGFFVRYFGQYSEHAYGTVYDYYYFNPDGVLTLLARCRGHGSDVFSLDLDGDGKQELCAEEQIFFQRDGVVYEARLPELLAEACPELSYWDQASWDRYSRRLTASGLATGDTPEAYGYDWTRLLYFDGESLLVYKNEAPTVDHMVEGADAGVPPVVVEKATQAAQLGLVEADGFYRRSNYRQHEADGHIEKFDDWRICAFYDPTVIVLGGVTVEAWSFTSEVHAVEPASIVIAGGNYLTEDGWTWNYTADNTIFLRREKNGSLNYLWTGFDDGTLDSHAGREGLARSMEEHGIPLEDGYTYAGLQVKSDLDLILDHSDHRVVLQLTTPEGQGGSYIVDPDQGNGPYYRNQFSQPGEYRWSRVEAPVQTPAGTTLILTDEYWYQMLQFWAGSDLVMSKGQNQDPVWYRAEPLALAPDDVYYYRTNIFAFLRGWFDEAEMGRRENIAIADHGDGPYEAAMAYLTLYEHTSKLNATPGSSYACTYAQVANVEILEDMPEAWFPADILDYPHFAFGYDLIFVPENEEALNTLMAGNTGEYEGSDPNVPQGAFQYSRRGSMYLKDGYWYCGGIGTG